MNRLFGTDGVRGIANQELTPELAFQLGQAGAIALAEELHQKPKILIGKDTRISSDLLESALAAGMCSVGADVIMLGTVPTPAVAYLTRKYEAHAGAVISASHNPMEYNGIKFFNRGGFKLSDEMENEIETIIADNDYQMLRPIGRDVGRIIYKFDALYDYITFAKGTIETRLDGLKIVLDCANGAASFAAPKIFEDLGAEVIVIHNMPDGLNINDNCGSTHVTNLATCVRANSADFGIAFDGDADRALAVDENGELIDGDMIMTICALSMKEKGTLNDNVLVATVMSNLGLFMMAKNNGLEVMQTKVGDRYVLERMMAGNYSLGGEQSGHVIFLEHNTTGDGIVTGLQLASIIASGSKKASEHRKVMTVMPQVLVNAHVKNENKEQYTQYAEIMNAITTIENEFAGDGRVLIRPSGTEPLIRVMIEGGCIEKITQRASFLAEIIEKNLA